MNGVDITATAFLAQKGRVFPKRSTIIGLMVDDVDTGIRIESDPGRKAVKTSSKWVVEHAEALLMQSPRFDEFYERAAIRARKLPSKGDKVTLEVTIGRYPVGTKGTVVRVDVEDKATNFENVYPVLFCPDGMPNAEIPLKVGEWSA